MHFSFPSLQLHQLLCLLRHTCPSKGYSQGLLSLNLQIIFATVGAAGRAADITVLRRSPFDEALRRLPPHSKILVDNGYMLEGPYITPYRSDE